MALIDATCNTSRGVEIVGMKLEVVVAPVSDVDRAKRFYETLGWRMDIDHVASEDFRVVQFTPPSSEASVIIGTGITSAVPGALEGVQLVVDDIAAAHDELVGRGVDVSDAFHDVGGGFHHAGSRDGQPARIRNATTTARSPRSATRTVTAGCCKR
jgi:catechol 2,3-dioxygenase-like lactoylglutathione lyase family enzyme